MTHISDEAMLDVSRRRAVLWADFVEQFRKKLHAFESQGKLKNVFIDEPLRNELTATAESGYLTIWLDTDSGKGSWNQLAPVDAAEPWFVGADGTVSLGGKEVPLAGAAQQFAAKLLPTGRRNDALQAELWTSWAAILRSYASLHGLNAREHAVVEISEAEITLRVGSRWMRFTPEQIADSRGGTMEFRLNEDGTVSRSGHADDEMDLAAEQITREMLHNQGGGKGGTAR